MTEESNAQTQVIEETSETLELLHLERTPRSQKMALEKALMRDADEVHFSERSVVTRAPIDEVRAGVDALHVEREARALPEARPPPPAPVLEPEPPAAAPEAQVSDVVRRKLTKAVGGKMDRVDPIYRTGAGEAVEVTYRDADGQERMRSFIVRNDEVADVDELGRVLDDIPAPTIEVEETIEPEAPAAPATPASAPAAAPAEEPAEEPKKRRFGRGPKKAAAEEAPEPAADEEPKKKRGFGFGRKKSDAEAAAEEAPEKAAEDAAPAEKKRGFRLGRK